MEERKCQKVTVVYYKSMVNYMDKKYFILIACFFSYTLISSTVCYASSPYGKIDVYYNGQLYPGNLTPKPVVEIGEPFTLRFDMTVNQYCKVNVELSDLGIYQGIESFTVIDGPSQLGKRSARIYDENETFTYEWTLKPTERWAGGSMPINFYYSILLPGDHETVTSGEFTAAYITISNEHYEPPASTKPGAQSSGDTSSPALPAFTLLGALAAVYAVYVLRRS